VKTIADLSTAPNAALCGAVGWAEETTLDVTMAHSLAPGANIVLLVANDCFDSSLYGAEQAIVAQSQYKGSIMTQSFGEPDDLVTCTALDVNGNCISYDPTLLNLPNSVFQTAQANQWTVIASSGDDGANEATRYTGNLELIPSFPSTSPLVLAAGGTQGSPYGGVYGGPPGPGGTFSCAAGATCNTGLVVINGGANGCGTAVRPGEPTSCYPTGYGGEGTWNEALVFGSVGYSSGGGISFLYGLPSYQQSVPTNKFTTLLGNKVQVTGRMVPDVSFNSAVYGGVMAYLGFLGRWAVFGGTSAASPAWAGIMALVNQAHGSPMGFVNPAIYNIGNSKSFHDITQGNNADCSGYCGEDGYLAGKNYDLTTGWGTPDVTHLINALAGN
jgi:subtilase family serine protease